MEQHLPYLADFHRAQQCLAGDAAAIVWLRSQLTGLVASYLIRSGVAAVEATEICENLLADLVMPRDGKKPRLVRYLGVASLETWLHAVALNQFLDHQRRKERERLLMPTTVTPTASQGEDDREPAWMEDPKAGSGKDAPLLALMRDAIDAAFRDCAPEDFVLLQLAHCDGLRGKELAVMFACHPAQISRRLTEAQKEIAGATLRYIRATDPWLDLQWDDFTDLCRTATPACFGFD